MPVPEGNVPIPGSPRRARTIGKRPCQRWLYRLPAAGQLRQSGDVSFRGSPPEGAGQRLVALLRSYFHRPGGDDCDWRSLAATAARMPAEKREYINNITRAVMWCALPADLQQHLCAADPSSQAGCASPTRDVAAICDDIAPDSAALCDGSSANYDDSSETDLDAWGRFAETVSARWSGLPGAAASDAGEPRRLPPTPANLRGNLRVRCAPAHGLPDAAAPHADEPPLAPGRTPPCRAARERSRTPARTSRARGGGGVQPSERAHAKNSPK